MRGRTEQKWAGESQNSGGLQPKETPEIIPTIIVLECAVLPVPIIIISFLNLCCYPQSSGSHPAQGQQLEVDGLAQPCICRTLPFLCAIPLCWAALPAELSSLDPAWHSLSAAPQTHFPHSSVVFQKALI